MSATDAERLPHVMDALARGCGLLHSEGVFLAEMVAELTKERDGFKANAELYFSVLERHGLARSFYVKADDDTAQGKGVGE